MVHTPHEWQSRLLKIFKGKGVVKAFPGTGKTYAAILLIKKNRYKDVIVAVPTRKLKHQWIEELTKLKVFNAVVETFHILSKQRSLGLKCDFLIVDECHRSTSPVFRRLYKNISALMLRCLEFFPRIDNRALNNIFVGNCTVSMISPD